ncbi:hypothetical protein SAMN04489860_1010 [Paraoerskovia marina]|uniref:Uncharacterized protein n=1 Tax=Paraoerskovia marina TaxID=545619 RepID=A0A1H1Q7W1_9CELL|nr:DUF6270 domain-containing protein [Paraoerskovia marina]SDS19464.1 hypothetical protein SAMN04489860_1010 [Paraoerskovia marina]
MRTPIRTFIYGSCVSRDTFEYLGDGFTLVDYVARQSLISAMTPPWAGDAPRAGFDSKFQQRMLHGDKNSNLIRRIARAKPANIDLLLWDITDERLGTWCGPDGSHLTRTVELLRTDAPERLSAKYPLRHFGSSEHFAEWLSAVELFVGHLRSAGLLARVVPIAVPWATHNELGHATPTSFGMDASEFNMLAQPYLAAIAHLVPIPATTVVTPRASSTHQWSEAPFHYTEADYRSLAEQISGTCERTIGFK